MKNRNRIACILIAALFISALVTLCAYFDTLSGLSAPLATDQAGENTGELTSLIETGSKLTLLLSDQEEAGCGRYVENLVICLTEAEEKPISLRCTVWRREGENEASSVSEMTFTDINPIYVRTETLKIRQDHVVSIDLERTDGKKLLFSDIRVDNSFHFNYYLFLSSFVILSCLFLLIFSAGTCLKEEKKRDIRSLSLSAFPVLCLGTGLLFTLCLPLNKTGCDEETHLQAVVQLSAFPSDMLHISDTLMNQLLVTEYNNPQAQPGCREEQEEFSAYLSENSDYSSGSRTPQFQVPANRIPAYFTMALFCRAGKELKLSWTFILRLLRLANLVTYTALVYTALKLTPRGQALMLLIALLPENIFLASTVSYDAFINGCSLLSMAFLLRMLEEKKNAGKINFSLLTGFSVSLMLACLVKAVYAPLFLTALLIPERKKKEKKQLIAAAAALAGFALLLLVFVLPTLKNPSAGGDIRGGEVSIRNQLAFIVSEPARYARILFSQMFRWIPQCFLGPDCTTFMGHIVHGSTAYQGSWKLILLLLFALWAGGIIFLKKSGKTSGPGTAQRLWLLFCCFACAVLIWTSMYLAFTPPGAEEIAGVQGRYFIPLLFPVYYALGAGNQLPAGRALRTISSEARGESPCDLPPVGSALMISPSEARGESPCDLPPSGSVLMRCPSDRAASERNGEPVLFFSRMLSLLPQPLSQLVSSRELWYHLWICGIAAALSDQFIKAILLPYCM